MGTVKKAGKAGARSLPNRSPSTPRKRAEAPQGDTQNDSDDAWLVSYLRRSDSWLWNATTAPKKARRMASIQRAVHGLHTVCDLLRADEDAREAANNPYEGLGGFHRGNLHSCQAVLIDSIYSDLESLRQLAEGGEL